MSSHWVGIETELEGVTSAVKNLRGDHRAVSEYVYHRACAFCGAGHEFTTVALIQQALAATEQQTRVQDE